MKGVLFDWGGVLTSNVFDSFRDFCVAEGLEPDAVKRLFREEPRARELVRGLETDALSEDEFGERFGELLELDDRTGLIERMFGGVRADERMLAAVRGVRAAGLRTGLISNSMGGASYDRDLFPQLFDGVVISGDVGLHKPQPEIFLLGAERAGVAPEQCVFVDDLRENIEGAKAVGMRGVLHRQTDETIARLRDLLEF